MTNFTWSSSTSLVEYLHASMCILCKCQLFSDVNQKTSQTIHRLGDSTVEKTNGTAIVLNWLPWKRSPSPEQNAVNWFLYSDIRCELCTRKQWLIADHYRCFQAGLKWNSLLLFITRCSIMNVRKVERAAVIYFQEIRGDVAVLSNSAGPAVVSGVLRGNPVLSHN